MKESLESAKAIYNTLVIVSTVILIFAISIIPRFNPYRSALEELSVYEDTIKNDIQKDKLWIRYYPTTKVYFGIQIDLIKADNELESLIKEKRGIVARNKVVEKKNWEITNENAEWLFKQLDTLYALKDTAITKGEILESEEYNLQIQETQENYFSQLKNLKANYSHPSFKYKRIADRASRKPYNPDSISINHITHYMVHRMDTALFVKTFSQSPDFVYFFNANFNKTVTDFKKLLEKEEEKFDQKPADQVDLSGFTIAAANMYIVAPLILAGLVVYLLFSIIHVNSILESEDDANEIIKFPWILLSKNGFISLVSTAVIMFPVIPVSIIFLYAEIDQGKADYILYPFLLLFFVCIWILSCYSDKIIKRIHKRPFV